MEPASTHARVLLVDDDPDVLRAHARLLARQAPLCAENGFAAREILTTTKVDVVVCDLGMPRMGGLDLMKWAAEHCPHPLWIVVSGQDTFEVATQALRLGVFDFLAKPLVSPLQLEASVVKALRHQDLVADRERLLRELSDNNHKLADSLRELERSYEVLRGQRAMLDQDFQRAARILHALLQNQLPALDSLQLNVAYRPSNMIGGDLYGATMLDDRHLAVYVADAAGHGVSAALLAVIFKQRLRPVDQRAAPRSPSSVLAELNDALVDECRASGLFVTVIYAVIDTRTWRTVIASAGHPSARVVRASGTIEHVDRTGPALGLGTNARFDEQVVTLAEDDRLVFFTDGLTAAASTLHVEDIDAIIRPISAEARDGAKVVADLLAWANRTGDCDDDVTLMTVTARPGASGVDTARSAPAAAPDRMPAAGDASEPAECPLSKGDADATTFVAIQGRVTWTFGPALHDVCCKAFDAGRDVILDLGQCAMLDSTLLGTVHDLTLRATGAANRPADASRGPAGSFSIQNVTDDVRQLFAELAMTLVLDRVVVPARPLPATMAPVRGGEVVGQDFILRAHELLAGLSPHNAAEFGPVVEALR